MKAPAKAVSALGVACAGFGMVASNAQDIAGIGGFACRHDRPTKRGSEVRR
jgi:hypothetical protein